MITCNCEACQKTFILTPDTTDYKSEPRKTYIDIGSCISGGIYSVEIVCPYCKHTHDMKGE